MLSSESLEYNFTLYQGATEQPIIAFYSNYVETTSTDDDGNTVTTVTKVPISLATSVLEMTIKACIGKKPIDYLTSNNGRINKITELNSETVSNAIELEFPSEITSEYQYPELIYDLYAIDSNNNKIILLYGKINVIKGVSHVL